MLRLAHQRPFWYALTDAKPQRMTVRKVRLEQLGKPLPCRVAGKLPFMRFGELDRDRFQLMRKLKMFRDPQLMKTKVLAL